LTSSGVRLSTPGAVAHRVHKPQKLNSLSEHRSSENPIVLDGLRHTRPMSMLRARPAGGRPRGTNCEKPCTLKTASRTRVRKTVAQHKQCRVVSNPKPKKGMRGSDGCCEDMHAKY